MDAEARWRRYPPEDCDHGRTHCSDCDLPFTAHRYPDDPPGEDVPLSDTRCMDAMIGEGWRLQATIDALLAERDALVAEHAHLKDMMRFGLGDPLCGVVSNSGPNGEPLACAWPPHGTERAHSWATLPTCAVEHATVAAVLAAAVALSDARHRKEQICQQHGGASPEVHHACAALIHAMDAQDAAVAAWRAARGER